MLNKETNRQRNARRNRYKLKKVANSEFRLSVHKSNKNVYVQVINDLEGKTVASASTLNSKASANVTTATELGKQIAESAKKAGVEQVVFDRGGFQYHGVVKAVAEAAREGGLKF